MKVYLLLQPSNEADEPVTRAWLHRQTWIADLRLHYDDDTAGCIDPKDVNPSTLSEEDLLEYIHTKTDDQAMECELIGPDISPEPVYQRVVVLIRDTNSPGDVVNVYSNPACLPPLREDDELEHIPVSKWDSDSPTR